MPAASHEIAAADNIQNWKYLCKIIPKMKNFDGQDVQLLIGANCLKALEPLELIKSEGDGSYAFRSRLCLTDVESNSSWYIPHQEFYVYHPNKLGEIRVVYDCSSEFQRRGLNKELLSGPNQTNQILFGVLSWFREHDVAFMADIESRLYQVVVSEEQRYYLNSYGRKIETITTQSLTVRGMCMCCLVPHPPLVVVIMPSKNIYRLQGSLWIPSFRNFAAKHLC